MSYDAADNAVKRIEDAYAQPDLFVEQPTPELLVQEAMQL